MWDNMKQTFNFRLKRIVKKDIDLRDRLSLMFVATGFSLSLFGVGLSIVMSLPYWYLLPNLMLALLCFIAPFVSDNIRKPTSVILLIVAYLYVPFLFFSSGGLKSSAALFFVMITIYEAFYYKGKALIFHVIMSLILYTTIIIYSQQFPEFLIIEGLIIGKTESAIIGVVMVSMVISILAITTFNGYNNEHKKSTCLMLELEKQNEKLRELSVKDQLTELYNRRHFLTVLKSELNYYKKYNQHFHMMILDLDEFKAINDTHGHLFGDEVLKKVANEINKSTRDYDVVARYGGEEFCILLSHLNPEDCMVVAERIRLHVEELKLRNNATMTVSIGVARNCKDDTVELLIQRADEMLYLAKSKGKNKVEYTEC